MNKARREIRDRFVFVVLSRPAASAAGQRLAHDASDKGLPTPFPRVKHCKAHYQKFWSRAGGKAEVLCL